MLQPTLVGDTVQLRPLRASDRDGLREAAADPTIWDQHPDDRSDPAEFDRFFDEHLASGGALLVTDRATGEVVGTSRYNGHDPARSEVQIGCTFFVRSRWGGPTNGEVKRLMLGHAFTFVESVLFFVHAGNRRSQRAVEKLGAVHEQLPPERSGERRVMFRLRRDAWGQR